MHQVRDVPRCNTQLQTNFFNSEMVTAKATNIIEDVFGLKEAVWKAGWYKVGPEFDAIGP